MWTKIAHSILKYRLGVFILLAVATAFMGYHASKVQLSYAFAKIVPPKDPDMLYFNDFRELFGKDDNILVVGIEDSQIYELEAFTKFKYYVDELTQIRGVDQVIAYPLMPWIEKDTEKRQFKVRPLFESIPSDQAELDSLTALAREQQILSRRLFASEGPATLVIVALNSTIMDSEQRAPLMSDIMRAGESFEKYTDIQLRYAGIPFVRSMMTSKVKDELRLFLILSVIVTAIILFLFFRSFYAVIFPLIVIGIMIIFTFGTLSLLDYRITLLTGLIPPIIVVIGVPNCVYLINQYHIAYAKHHNKAKSLSIMIRKVGLVTLLTNFTTAVGMLVLIFTDITLLREFGLVAGLNIMATFLVTLLFIPNIFALLPAPGPKQLKHLESKSLTKILDLLEIIVFHHRKKVFIVMGVVVVIAVIGFRQLEAVSYMVDDIPEESQAKKDLRFFESRFGGVMPLEIIIESERKNAVSRLPFLRKVDELDAYLDSIPEMAPPLSVVNFVKAARQAYYNNNPAYYSLPNNQDRAFVLSYLKGSEDSFAGSQMSSLVDSTGSIVRMSIQMADLGSKKMDSLIEYQIKPKIDAIFADESERVEVTGSTKLFVKGIRYLIDNLVQSMLLAFLIISIIMALIFRSFKMILISLLPNMIPLLVTAGLMGYMGIHLKPSTALIFSIAFGISVDDSIHFLAKYRQELVANRFKINVAISKSIQETGASMIYTSIILFFGFVIFAGSEFGGTVALGILTSITLLVAMITNLTLLPSLLIIFNPSKKEAQQYEENEDK
ncbi:MAG: MMPL family transporter [Cyclobacteriaceae bacterium]|nr:MMPL family transporter [Cyclobacteriaceae bacterium]MCH8515487.1 MMPL family transporter [Cyclobacteriaceae bacterium]